jgi:ClpX C4-type zinc finger
MSDALKALPTDRATAAEPVVSALRDGIPSADNLRCSFCGMDQNNVKWLVAAPWDRVCICDACTDTAAEIIEEKRFDARVAKAIEARQGGNGEAGAVHESAGRKALPETSEDTHND